MNRLQSELHRLYGLRPQPDAGHDALAASALAEPADSRVRAMVMELTGPPSWEVLARVWHGVQAELELPAPAIAVSGTDGLQLWFSLEAPIAASRAHAFLEGLRSRFLADIEPGRVRLMPGAGAPALSQAGHSRPVPARQEETGNWSAFLAPDLAPVFADTPWLDIEPNEEGQAALLRGLHAAKSAAFEAALTRLGASPHPPPSPAAVAAGSDGRLTHARPEDAAADTSEDPKRFLLRVMNDDTVALALRIEAAKALLAHSNEDRPRPSG
jgi:hypothetical protein